MRAGKALALRKVKGLDGLTLALLALLLLSVTLSVERADWVEELPSISLTVLVALGAGYALARLRLPTLLRHFLGVFLSLPLALVQMTPMLLSTGWRERIKEVIARVNFWVEAAQSGGISSDPLTFVLTLLLLSWLLAYFSLWLLTKRRGGFLIPVPSGMGILLNLYYAPRSLAPLFLLYLLVAMLLVARLNLVHQEQFWKESHIFYPREVKLTQHLGIFALCLALVFLSWELPWGAWSGGSHLWPKLGPWKGLATGFERLFPTLASERTAPQYTFGPTLPFRGQISLSGETVFRVFADRRGYWRGNTYEVYTPQGWQSGARVYELQDKTTTPPPPSPYKLRKEVIQTVELVKGFDVFFYTGQPLTSDLPTQVEKLRQPSYLIDRENPASDRSLPPELGSWAAEWRRIGQVRTPPPLPPKYKAVRTERRGARIIGIQVELAEGEAAGISTLRSPKPLLAGQRYTLISSQSIATPEDLITAGGLYPEEIKAHFLSLPPGLPSRVRQLAVEITQDLDTPYDKARGIETYLRTLNYSLNIKPPPPNSDGVDYFLFNAKTGYCDYFASAMAVMLRSLGIPSRIAAGYSTGEVDTKSGAYVVREKDAHSWPEVFFPGYGWVEFEPTPSQPASAHGPEPPGIDIPLGTGGEDLEDEDFYEGDLLRGESSLFRRWGPRALGIILLVALILFLIRAIRRVWRWLDLSGLSYEARTYEKICRLASWAGLAPQPGQTPQEYAHTLSSALPQSADTINAIVDLYIRRSYGHKVLTEDARLKAEGGLPQLRRRLLWQLLQRKKIHTNKAANKDQRRER